MPFRHYSPTDLIRAFESVKSFESLEGVYIDGITKRQGFLEWSLCICTHYLPTGLSLLTDISLNMRCDMF